MIAINQIKSLRQKTGAPVMACKRALEKAKGNEKKAEELLKKWGVEKAKEKKERKTEAGIIDSYIHGGGKAGVLLELACETDFVAKTDDFGNLAHELCLQIVSMNPKNVDALLAQEYIRDSKIKIRELVKQTIGKLGENIKIVRFIRFELGKSR